MSVHDPAKAISLPRQSPSVPEPPVGVYGYRKKTLLLKRKEIKIYSVNVCLNVNQLTKCILCVNILLTNYEKVFVNVSSLNICSRNKRYYAVPAPAFYVQHIPYYSSNTKVKKIILHVKTCPSYCLYATGNHISNQDFILIVLTLFNSRQQTRSLHCFTMYSTRDDQNISLI